MMITKTFLLIIFSQLYMLKVIIEVIIYFDVKHGKLNIVSKNNKNNSIFSVNQKVTLASNYSVYHKIACPQLYSLRKFLK